MLVPDSPDMTHGSRKWCGKSKSITSEAHAEATFSATGAVATDPVAHPYQNHSVFINSFMKPMFGILICRVPTPQRRRTTTRVKDTTRRVASIVAAIQLASWCLSKMAKKLYLKKIRKKKTIKVGLASMYAMGKAASRWSATIPATRRVASIFAAIQLTAWCLTIRNLVKQCRHTRSSHHQMGRRYS